MTVVTPGGTSGTSSADQFTYEAVPTVTGISPASGPLAGGTMVTITGTDLADATAVKFGATAATTFFISNTGTQIVLNSPAGSAGTVDVTVVTAGGTSATSSADLFTYAAVPTVTGISPTAGPLAGGTAVTITGTNLAGATAVKFGATAATTFLIGDTGTQIVFNSPAASAGPVDVTVVTAGGTSATSSADQFTYDGRADGDGHQSDGGAVGGRHHGDDHRHEPGRRDGREVRRHGGDHVYERYGHPDRGDQPGGQRGHGGRDGGHGGRHVGHLCRPTSSPTWPAPTVTGISPTAGPLAGGTSVTITGTNLAGATAVKFGSTAVTTFSSDTATQIVLTSPAGSAGTVDVTVVTPGGTSATSSADQFTYVAAPTVTGISPTAGPAAGGTR